MCVCVDTGVGGGEGVVVEAVPHPQRAVLRPPYSTLYIYIYKVEYLCASHTRSVPSCAPRILHYIYIYIYIVSFHCMIAFHIITFRCIIAFHIITFRCFISTPEH